MMYLMRECDASSSRGGNLYIEPLLLRDRREGGEMMSEQQRPVYMRLSCVRLM